MISCKKCKFFVDQECRRFPPIDNHSSFPIVNEDEWCGEYSQNDR